MIGGIGNSDLDMIIPFEVSDEKVLTIQNFVRSSSVRFAKNDVLLKKPVSQYVGPELDTLSFDIKLMAQHGVNPTEEMKKLIVLQRNGTLVSFILGDWVMGMYRWTIQSLTNNFEQIDNRGNILSMTVNISLLEYV